MTAFPHSGFIKREEKGVTFFSAENIPFVHGFSTRLGGVSALSHLASLNLGYGRGEEDWRVDENFRRFLGAASLVKNGEDPLLLRAMAPQIHSNRLHYVKTGGVYPEGDGFYTDSPDVILTVKIADCVPILLADPKKKLIAALHAGWRGTVSGIAEKGVEALVGMGACREDIVAAVGPSIHACCYEVGEDFYQAVEKARSSAFADTHITKRDGRLFANVAGMNCEILQNNGVREEHIALSRDCTACQNELFFSHRAQKGMRGTMVAAIRLLG